MERTEVVDGRRRALLLGAAGAAAVGGMGCTAPGKRPEIEGLCGPLQPFLAGPEVLRAWDRHPRRFFDAHTHFFNARDVHVEGFVAKSIAHHGWSDRERELLIRLAPVAQRLSRIAWTPGTESKVLCGRAAKQFLSLDAATADLDREIDEGSHTQDIVDALHEQMQRDSRIRTLIDGAGPDKGATHPLIGTTVLSRDYVAEALREGALPPGRAARPPNRATLAPEAREAADLKSIVQFIGFMLSPRYYNLRRYIRTYARQSPDVPLSGCFAALVDFSYWLGPPRQASHPMDQVLLHEQLSLLSRGFLLPLVAYNPLVDALDGDASLKVVQDAVDKHGCVGVKIYPPMGFRPFGNAGLTFPRGVTGTVIDKKLLALYAFCQDRGVPVMAHAKESMGLDDDHDKLAAAAGWDELANKGGLRSLAVNAGHFGGDVEKEGSTDWTPDFARLMRAQGPLRVYGDLGYWDALSQPHVRSKLLEVLKQSIGGTGTVADRVLYGTDWHMLAQVPGWGGYASEIAVLLQSADGSGELARKVMGANVLDCFGLQNHASVAFARLMAHHEKLSGGRPGWAPAGKD